VRAVGTRRERYHPHLVMSGEAERGQAQEEETGRF
jgi:hypothetical protein